jgi:hypothetical protein
MPLLDDETIDSLHEPLGWSHYSLFLLGAIPISHRGLWKKYGGKFYCPHLLPAEQEWRPKVLCSRISKSRLRSIRRHAKEIRKPVRASEQTVSGVRTNRVRATSEQVKPKPEWVVKPAWLRKALPSSENVRLRRLRRKIETRFKAILAMVDKEME